MIRPLFFPIVIRVLWCMDTNPPKEFCDGFGMNRPFQRWLSQKVDPLVKYDQEAAASKPWRKRWLDQPFPAKLRRFLGFSAIFVFFVGRLRIWMSWMPFFNPPKGNSKPHRIFFGGGGLKTKDDICTRIHRTYTGFFTAQKHADGTGWTQNYRGAAGIPAHHHWCHGPTSLGFS